MKRISFVAIFSLMSLIASSHAHSQSVDSSFSFYPLHVGDIWEYHWQNWIANPGLHLYYQKTEVFGDTLMQNGLKYFSLRVTNLDTKTFYIVFQRIDSADGYVHQWADSAHDPALPLNLRSTYTYPDTILGVPTQARNTGLVEAGCALVYGFGIVGQQEYGSGWPYRSTIIFARVNGVNYGIALSVLSAPAHPSEFQLYQNYPNPFNPSTTIRFNVPIRSRIRLTIFNLLGQQVAQLMNEEVNAGNFERVWNANVASGLYFYRLEAVSVSDPNRRFVDVKKMVLLR